MQTVSLLEPRRLRHRRRTGFAPGNQWGELPQSAVPLPPGTVCFCCIRTLWRFPWLCHCFLTCYFPPSGLPYPAVHIAEGPAGESAICPHPALDCSACPRLRSKSGRKSFLQPFCLPATGADISKETALLDWKLKLHQNLWSRNMAVKVQFFSCHLGLFKNNPNTWLLVKPYRTALISCDNDPEESSTATKYQQQT